MGSVSQQLQRKVQEDPAVATYTDVGYSILTGVDRSDTNFNTLSRSSGLVYVKDGDLHHETTLGSKLCCRKAKHSFKLCNVERLEVVQGDITILRKKGHRNTQHIVPMKLGLRIVFNNKKTLVMEMIDAVKFCARLNQYIVSSRLMKEETLKTHGVASTRRAAHTRSVRYTNTQAFRSATTHCGPDQRVQNIYVTLGGSGTLPHVSH